MPDDETDALRQFSPKPSSSAKEYSVSTVDNKRETQYDNSEDKQAALRGNTSTVDGSDGDSIGSFVVLRDRRLDVNER